MTDQKQSQPSNPPPRVCTECRFHTVHYRDGERWCLCPDAPISDYITGRRRCRDINARGDCPFFEKRKPKPEPKKAPKSLWRGQIVRLD